MTLISRRLIPALVASAAVLTAGAAFAQSAPATLGDKVASGQMSEAAFVQLVAGAGVTLEEARGMTVEDVVRIKWTDD